jgi:hypothetical protein
VFGALRVCILPVAHQTHALRVNILPVAHQTCATGIFFTSGVLPAAHGICTTGSHIRWAAGKLFSSSETSEEEEECACTTHILTYQVVEHPTLYVGLHASQLLMWD